MKTRNPGTNLAGLTLKKIEPVSLALHLHCLDATFRRLDPKSRYAVLLCTLAARGDDQTVARTLEIPECDPRAGDYDNRTPLHVAAEAGPFISPFFFIPPNLFPKLSVL